MSKVFNFFGRVFGFVMIIGFLVGMLWMFSWLTPFGLSGILNSDEIQDLERPEKEAIEPESEAPSDDSVATPWRCSWSPTMNDDWHDDVVCQRGAETARPRLLTDWSYVTQDDMMLAAREYEAVLNG
ncbi:hypothetical protein I6E68_07075 [Salinibacterium sp. NSLL150]|uniref:hypothetical protein n=1 Tax=unclassified Salinibacterium TaxID=2632331 RepID=UPI0018CF551D|nr:MULTISPECIES: hypothetical protein [unclassified Salinibacterium]MBH0098898.1 hypothetical protein [Salinibacterium sp. NSLL35]MBH0101653.1 hypothetical protein [Salinibacterium sp. NSLL150]MBH0104412.1 hypothetical protein [Salinibacterium sp. NSLL16]MBH0107173.1 hypothetical protein [Salinibacterium sp. NSLL17]